MLVAIPVMVLLGAQSFTPPRAVVKIPVMVLLGTQSFTPPLAVVQLSVKKCHLLRLAETVVPTGVPKGTRAER